VNDLVWLDAAAAKALEPELRVAAALHSPSTGIVDSHRHALRLEHTHVQTAHGAFKHLRNCKCRMCAHTSMTPF